MDGWTTAWLLWIAMFLVVEGAAIWRKVPGATLSEHIWRWASITDKGRGWRQRRFTLLAGLAWLVAHLLTGGAF